MIAMHKSIHEIIINTIDSGIVNLLNPIIKIIPVSISTIGYKHEILFLQLLHFPFSRIYDIIGILL